MLNKEAQKLQEPIQKAMEGYDRDVQYIDHPRQYRNAMDRNDRCLKALKEIKKAYRLGAVVQYGGFRGDLSTRIE
ncbi:MAG: hypothetical protein ACRCX8_14205 [Sarcina sp.]